MGKRRSYKNTAEISQKSADCSKSFKYMEGSFKNSQQKLRFCGVKIEDFVGFDSYRD